MAALTGKEDKIHINKVLYRKIVQRLTTSNFEEGGIVGMKCGAISHFEKDLKPQHSSERCYIPNTEYLERIIEQWSKDGVELAGIVHSHTLTPTPSKEDIEYVQSTLLLNDLLALVLGIAVKSDSFLHFYIVSSSDIHPIEHRFV